MVDPSKDQFYQQRLAAPWPSAQGQAESSANPSHRDSWPYDRHRQYAGHYGHGMHLAALSLVQDYSRPHLEPVQQQPGPLPAHLPRHHQASYPTYHHDPYAGYYNNGHHPHGGHHPAATPHRNGYADSYPLAGLKDYSTQAKTVDNGYKNRAYPPPPPPAAPFNYANYSQYHGHPLDVSKYQYQPQNILTSVLQNPLPSRPLPPTAAAAAPPPPTISTAPSSHVHSSSLFNSGLEKHYQNGSVDMTNHSYLSQLVAASPLPVSQPPPHSRPPASVLSFPFKSVEEQLKRKSPPLPAETEAKKVKMDAEQTQSSSYKFKSALLSRGAPIVLEPPKLSSKTVPLSFDVQPNIFMETCDRFIEDMNSKPVSVSKRASVESFLAAQAAKAARKAERKAEKEHQKDEAAKRRAEREEKKEKEKLLEPPPTQAGKNTSPKKRRSKKQDQEQVKENQPQQNNNVQPKKGGTWALPIVPKMPQKPGDKKSDKNGPQSKKTKEPQGFASVWLQAFGAKPVTVKQETVSSPAPSEELQETKMAKTYLDIPPEKRRRPKPNFGGLIHFSPDWERAVQRHHEKSRMPNKLIDAIRVIIQKYF